MNVCTLCLYRWLMSWSQFLLWVLFPQRGPTWSFSRLTLVNGPVSRFTYHKHTSFEQGETFSEVFLRILKSNWEFRVQIGCAYKMQSVWPISLQQLSKSKSQVKVTNQSHKYWLTRTRLAWSFWRMDKKLTRKTSSSPLDTFSASSKAPLNVWKVTQLSQLETWILESVHRPVKLCSIASFP